MADPMTELAKEFLYLNKYHVSTNVKFYKNKEFKGTPGDIDIIARRVKKLQLSDFSLRNNIVAEVKSNVIKRVKQFDDIYDDKFSYINDETIGWSQLKEYLPTRNFERILFCLAVKDEVYEYALEKYHVRIISFGLIFKELNKKYQESGRRTYIPDAPFYSMTRWISLHLYQSHLYKDKLGLADFVWIYPDEEPKLLDEFNKINSEFMADFLWQDNDALRKMFSRDPYWVVNEIIDMIKRDEIINADRKKIVKLLKKESDIWDDVDL